MTDNLTNTATTQGAVSPSKFAADHGVSRATVFQHIATGDIRSYRLGGRRLIPKTEYARLAALAHPPHEVAA